MIVVFLKAGIAGFSIAAPIGSLGIICIRRTMAEGFRAGLISGLGVALADGVYAAIAALGLDAAAGYVGDFKRPLLLVSGVFVLCLGWIAFKDKDIREQKDQLTTGSAIRGFAITFFLTLSHPLNIVAYTAIFTSFDLAANDDAAAAILIICGVFFGSLLWWVILCGCVARIRPETASAIIRIMNRLSALLLVAFGLWALIEASNIF
jgi:putative LysE/RhtB family amino acid efflux pump